MHSVFGTTFGEWMVIASAVNPPLYGAVTLPNANAGITEAPSPKLKTEGLKMPVNNSVCATLAVLDTAESVRRDERLEWESLNRVLLEIRADCQDAIFDSAL
jgi:hypothetical protein